MNQEPADLDRRAAEAQPHPPARLKLDEMTSDQLDTLYERLARTEAELQQYAEAESADAAAGSYAHRAEAAEREAERLRTDLTEAREWEQYGRQLAARAADTAMTACKNHDRLRKEAEQQRDQYAGVLREVLDALVHNGGIPPTEADVDRWHAVLDDKPSPLAAVEVRDPCPRCEDCGLVPRTLMADHMRYVHHEEQRPGLAS